MRLDWPVILLTPLLLRPFFLYFGEVQLFNIFCIFISLFVLVSLSLKIAVSLGGYIQLLCFALFFLSYAVFFADTVSLKHAIVDLLKYAFFLWVLILTYSGKKIDIHFSKLRALGFASIISHLVLIPYFSPSPHFLVIFSIVSIPVFTVIALYTFYTSTIFSWLMVLISLAWRGVSTHLSRLIFLIPALYLFIYAFLGSLDLEFSQNSSMIIRQKQLDVYYQQNIFQYIFGSGVGAVYSAPGISNYVAELNTDYGHFFDWPWLGFFYRMGFFGLFWVTLLLYRMNKSLDYYANSINSWIVVYVMVVGPERPEMLMLLLLNVVKEQSVRS